MTINTYSHFPQRAALITTVPPKHVGRDRTTLHPPEPQSNRAIVGPVERRGPLSINGGLSYEICDGENGASQCARDRREQSRIPIRIRAPGLSGLEQRQEPIELRALSGLLGLNRGPARGMMDCSLSAPYPPLIRLPAFAEHRLLSPHVACISRCTAQ